MLFRLCHEQNYVHVVISTCKFFYMYDLTYKKISTYAAQIKSKSNDKNFMVYKK